jgi:hypothetical protein
VPGLDHQFRLLRQSRDRKQQDHDNDNHRRAELSFHFRSLHFRSATIVVPEIYAAQYSTAHRDSALAQFLWRRLYKFELQLFHRLGDAVQNLANQRLFVSLVSLDLKTVDLLAVTNQADG